MKEIFYIDDTPTGKITYYLLLAFLIALPFELYYSELALACLLIHTVIQTRWKKPVHWQPALLLVAAVYFVTMTGTLLSGEMHRAFKDWEKQLALLLFPIIFSLTELDLQKYKLPLLKAFGLSCLFAVLYLFAMAARDIRFNHLPWSALYSAPFMNHRFSMPIGLHATYFSMYIAISVITFAFLWMRSRRSRDKILYGAAVVILMAALLQLGSKAVWMAVTLLVMVIPFFWLERRNARRFLFIIVPVAVCGLLVMVNVGSLRNRYLGGLKEDLMPSAEVPGLIEPRVVRWGCAWDLVKSSPWVGHGTGTEVPMLKDLYFERHLYSSFLNELNAHNEFISFLLQTGVIGLLVFLSLLTAGFVQAIRTRDAFFLGFLVISVMVALSENILDTNKGIFFFSFFFSLFFATTSLSSTRK